MKTRKADFEKRTKDLLSFIEKSPTAFHAVEQCRLLLKENGFQELKEAQEWKIVPGGAYFVCRNDTSVAAFRIPDCGLAAAKGFHAVAAHSDSPTFKVKENAEMKTEKYCRLNVEKYGGMILSSWLDRPLSLAGRVVYASGEDVKSTLVNIDRDYCVIPNVAIHMNREINDGFKYNPQTDMLPLAGTAEDTCLAATLAKAIGKKVTKDDILSYDLFLYVRDIGRIFGNDNEYILSPRLDDLQCAFSAVTAITESIPGEYADLCLIFDNEEVGSGTAQGADSTFLEDLLRRLAECSGMTFSALAAKIPESLLISADNAHAVHPAHPEKADPTNRPYINGGVVIKYHGGQKYTTDAVSAAQIKLLCKAAKVPFQTFTNRSDMMGGSTLGNISTAHVSFPSADIGMPQLAMHSAVETGGMKDTEYAVRLMKEFYSR